jgi:hypothetical protein
MSGVFSPAALLRHLARGRLPGGPRRRRSPRWECRRLTCVNPSRETLAHFLEFAGLPEDLAQSWALVLHRADGYRDQKVRCGHGVTVRLRRRRRRWHCTIAWRRVEGRRAIQPMIPD